MPKNRSAREHRITTGGRKLKKLLDRTGTALTTFAKNSGVDRVTLHRIMTGERWKFISVDFAIAACAEAKGAVRFEDFSSLTATPVDAEDNDEEGPGRRHKAA